MKKLFAGIVLSLSLVLGGAQTTLAYSRCNATSFERNHNLIVDYNTYQKKDVSNLVNEYANGRMDKFDIIYRLLNQCDNVDFSYTNDAVYMTCYNECNYVYSIVYYYGDDTASIEFSDCTYNGKSLSKQTIGSIINSEVSKCKSKNCSYQLCEDYTNNEMSRVYMKGILVNGNRLIKFYNSDGKNSAPTMVQLVLA